MHLDEWNTHPQQSIAQDNTGMRETGRIEDDEIRATDLESLQKTLAEYKITDADIKEEDFHPGLRNYIVDIKSI